MRITIYLFLIISIFSCNNNETSDSENKKEDSSAQKRPYAKTNWAEFDLTGNVKSLHVSYYFAKAENESYSIGEKMKEEENYYYFDTIGYIQEHYILKEGDTISRSRYKYDGFGYVLEMEMKSWAEKSLTKKLCTYLKDDSKIIELKFFKNDTLQYITNTHWENMEGGWLKKEIKKDTDGNTISEWEYEIFEDGKGNVTELKEIFMGKTLKHEQYAYDSEYRLTRFTTLAGMATIEYNYLYDSLGLNTEIILTNSNGANKQTTKITYEFGNDSLNWNQCFRNTDNKNGYYEKREIEYY